MLFQVIIKIKSPFYYLKCKSINLSNKTIEIGFRLTSFLSLVILNNGVVKISFPFSQGRSSNLPPPPFVSMTPFFCHGVCNSRYD